MACQFGFDIGVLTVARRTTATTKAPAPAQNEHQPLDTFEVTGPSLDNDEISVEGGLLALTPNGVVGWGRNLASPTNPLHVVLLANELPVGVALCDRFDIELVRSQVGVGIPGFVIPWYRKAFPSELIRLTLRDVKGKLLGGPIIIDGDADFGSELETPDGQFEGAVDRLRDGVLLGWARNVETPTLPVMVELYDGSDRLARQSARLYRDDLRAAGKNDGNCAFQFELPISLLDDQVHSLRVVVAGTQFELINSPIQFGRLEYSRIVTEVVQLRQELSKLQAAIDLVVTPNGRVQSEIIRTLYERITALSEIQHEMVEQELNALRKLWLTMPPADFKKTPMNSKLNEINKLGPVKRFKK
jgi:hypothetical protein